MRKDGHRTLTARAKQVRAIASGLFAERGFHGTRTRDIAERAGILQGSLYGHFRSKEELFFSILKEGVEEEIARLKPIVDSPQSAAERLTQAIFVTLSAAHQNPDFHRAVQDWRALDEDHREEVRLLMDEVKRLWEQIIEDGIREGQFHCNPKLGRLFTVESAKGFLRWYKTTGPIRFEEVLEELASLILNGLAGRKPSMANRLSIKTPVPHRG